MTILCLGLSHHTAPLSLLEHLTFNSESLTALMREIRDGEIVREVAGLSTCNRTEFYLECADAEAARQKLTGCLTSASRMGGPVLAEHSYVFEDADAVRHLFRVACGVDSLIVGEKQILGQLREALELGESAGTANGLVAALLQRAIKVGRRAHQETAISRGNVSVASIAVGISRKIFSDLSRCRVLMLGAGQTAKVALQNLAAGGIGSVIVANRTLSRAQQLAEEFGGKGVRLDDFRPYLGDADIIVAATGAQSALIRPEDITGYRPKVKTQVYLDLSLPRNIDPAISQARQVFLYGIEDLEGVARENRAQREAEAGKVELIIDDEVGRFLRWIAQGESDRLVVLLRRRIEETRVEHLERHTKDLPPDVAQRFDKFSQSLLKSVFHDLTNNLRRLDPKTEAGQLQYEMACRLLNLEKKSK